MFCGRVGGVFASGSLSGRVGGVFASGSLSAPRPSCARTSTALPRRSRALTCHSLRMPPCTPCARVCVWGDLVQASGAGREGLVGALYL